MVRLCRESWLPPAERSNRALEGQTPAAFGTGEKLAVADLETVQRRRLVRRSFAHGQLNSYELVETETCDGKRQAA